MAVITASVIINRCWRCWHCCRARWALACLAVVWSALVPGRASGAAQDQPPVPAQTSSAPASKVAAQAPDEVVLDPSTVGKRVPAKHGDICMVCNQPIDRDDAVYLLRGHRVAIHQGELSTNLGDQLARLLAQLEPRGAFLGAGQDHPALSRAWFLFGLYILVGLVFAASCAHRALHAGRNPSTWFALGLALNVLGYLFLLTRPKREVFAPAGMPSGLRKVSATYAPRPCPGCSTLNHPSADTCLGCGGKLEPKLVSEVARAGMRAT